MTAGIKHVAADGVHFVTYEPSVATFVVRRWPEHSEPLATRDTLRDAAQAANDMAVAAMEERWAAE